MPISNSGYFRAIERVGAITLRPVLGGLHHQYCRIRFSAHTAHAEALHPWARGVPPTSTLYPPFTMQLPVTRSAIVRKALTKSSLRVENLERSMAQAMAASARVDAEVSTVAPCFRRCVKQASTRNDFRSCAFRTHAATAVSRQRLDC
jgi:hypothetical protein